MRSFAGIVGALVGGFFTTTSICFLAGLLSGWSEGVMLGAVLCGGLIPIIASIPYGIKLAHRWFDGAVWSGGLTGANRSPLGMVLVPAGFYSFVGAGLLAFVINGSTPPSIAQIAKEYGRHRSDLNRFVSLLINSNPTPAQGPSQDGPVVTSPFDRATPEALALKNRFRSCHVVGADTDEIRFEIWNKNGVDEGLLYFPSGVPTRKEVPDIATYHPTPDEALGYMICQHLEGNWYIYYTEDDD